MRTNIVVLWIMFVGAYLLGGSPPETEAQTPPLKQLLSERDPHEIANDADLDDLLGALEEAVPSKPANPTIREMKLMAAVAITKDPRAIALLIHALAFNLDPFESNESRAIADIIPAMGLLKKFFGEVALPQLYEDGIKAEQDWYRTRIAYTIRLIGLGPEETRKQFRFESVALRSSKRPGYYTIPLVAPSKTLDRMNVQFAEQLHETPLGEKFAVLLSAEKIELELYYPRKEVDEELSKRLETLKEAQRNGVPSPSDEAPDKSH